MTPPLLCPPCLPTPSTPRQPRLPCAPQEAMGASRRAIIMHMSSTRSFHPDLVSAPDVQQPPFKSSHATRCINKYQHLTLEVGHLVDIVFCNNCVSWDSRRLHTNRSRANMTAALTERHRRHRDWWRRQRAPLGVSSCPKSSLTRGGKSPCKPSYNALRIVQDN